MSIRNNAYFNKLMVGVVLSVGMPNVAFAHNRAFGWGDSDIGRFGSGMSDSELSVFNELDQINPGAGNYAEVMLENSILGEVYIEQVSHKKGNKAKVVQSSDSERSKANIWQYGNANTALITQEGMNNQAYIAQYGSSNKAWISQSGNNNTAASVQFGYGSSMCINQQGNNYLAYMGA